MVLQLCHPVYLFTFCFIWKYTSTTINKITGLCVHKHPDPAKVVTCRALTRAAFGCSGAWDRGWTGPAVGQHGQKGVSCTGKPQNAEAGGEKLSSLSLLRGLCPAPLLAAHLCSQLPCSDRTVSGCSAPKKGVNLGYCATHPARDGTKHYSLLFVGQILGQEQEHGAREAAVSRAGGNALGF